MPEIPIVSLMKKTVPYPQIVLDDKYGTTFAIDLFRTDAIRKYVFSITEGTLNGGSSPAWTVSGTNPIITHVQIKADNDTIYDIDTIPSQNLYTLLHSGSFNGLNYNIQLTDIDYQSKKEFELTVFPSYAYNQVKMYITVAPLSQITSGSHTSTTGTVMNLVEYDIDRSSVNFPPLRVKKLQFATTLSINGENDLTTFLSQDGSYKDLMLIAQSSQPSTAGLYPNTSDSLISKIGIIINNAYYPYSSYWSAIKQENQAIFGNSMPTGFVDLVFMPDNEASNLLSLFDVNAIKNVNLKINTTASGVYLTAIKTEYF